MKSSIDCDKYGVLWAMLYCECEGSSRLASTGDVGCPKCVAKKELQRLALDTARRLATAIAQHGLDSGLVASAKYGVERALSGASPEIDDLANLRVAQLVGAA